MSKSWPVFLEECTLWVHAGCHVYTIFSQAAYSIAESVAEQRIRADEGSSIDLQQFNHWIACSGM